MPNGAAAVRLLPEFVPSQLPDQPPSELERKIGTAAALAASAVARMALDWHRLGYACPDARERGGTLLAELYTLSIGTPDFASLLQRWGKHELRQRLGGEVSEHIIDGLLDELVAIMNNITAAERQFAN